MSANVKDAVSKVAIFDCKHVMSVWLPEDDATTSNHIADHAHNHAVNSGVSHVSLMRSDIAISQHPLIGVNAMQVQRLKVHVESPTK
jgi:hypothetical protein